MHPAQVHDCADQGPFGPHLADASHADLPESQDVLDPSEDWFDDPLSLSVTILSLLTPHPLPHGIRARMSLFLARI